MAQGNIVVNIRVTVEHKKGIAPWRVHLLRLFARYVVRVPLSFKKCVCSPPATVDPNRHGGLIVETPEGWPPPTPADP